MVFLNSKINWGVSLRHEKNFAFSKKDAKERVICTKLSRSKRVDFFHTFEVR